MKEVHVITCEYPPQTGGVSDYVYLITSKLASTGWVAHVWGPRLEGKPPGISGASFHDEMGRFSPSDIKRTDNQLNQFSSPRHLFVQWVPHGYGYKSLNIWFCFWIWKRAKVDRDIVDLMIHEPFLGFTKKSWRQNFAALTHRIMMVLLLNAADHVLISVPAWEKLLMPYALGKKVPFKWLPIPSGIPVYNLNREKIALLKKKYLGNSVFLIGHFGTYGGFISELLIRIIPKLTHHCPDRKFLFLGKNSDKFCEQLLQAYPDLKSQIYSTGMLDQQSLSEHIQACDIFIQPYPDGVSSRRTSIMTLLAHGLPVVTTKGFLTEPLWVKSNAIFLSNNIDNDKVVELIKRLLNNPIERKGLGEGAKIFYQRNFNIDCNIKNLIKILSLSSKAL